MANPTMANLIRVLVADDHPIVRNGLVQMVNLADGMAVVAEAATGLEAVEQFRAVQPDVALMDLRMPEMTGVEATPQFAKSFPMPASLFSPLTTPTKTSFSGCRQAQRATCSKILRLTTCLTPFALSTRATSIFPPPLEPSWPSA